MKHVHTGKNLRDLYISLVSAMIAGRIVAGFAKAWIFTPGVAPFAWVTTSLVTGIPQEQLTALGADSWEAVGQFYTEVFRDSRIPWSALGPRPFMPEYDPQASTDDFLMQ